MLIDGVLNGGAKLKDSLELQCIFLPPCLCLCRIASLFFFFFFFLICSCTRGRRDILKLGRRVSISILIDHHWLFSFSFSPSLFLVLPSFFYFSLALSLFSIREYCMSWQPRGHGNNQYIDPLIIFTAEKNRHHPLS